MLLGYKVGSYEGSSARGILSLGADVALIFTKRKKLTRLTVRATNHFYRETGLNFGSNIMQPLGVIFGGEGGGHSTAAALTIPSEIQEIELMEKAFKLITEYLKSNSSS